MNVRYQIGTIFIQNVSKTKQSIFWFMVKMYSIENKIQYLHKIVQNKKF